MSHDDYTRRQAENDLRNNQHTQRIPPHQGDHHTRQTYNNELDRLRREEEERRRQQNQ